MRHIIIAIIVNCLAPAIYLVTFYFGLSEYNSIAHEVGYQDIFQACSLESSLPANECDELNLLKSAQTFAYGALIFGALAPILLYFVPAILGRVRFLLGFFFPLAIPIAFLVSLATSLLSIVFLGLAGHIFLTWVLQIIWPYFYILLGLGGLFLVGVVLVGFGNLFSSTSNLEFGAVLKPKDVPELFKVLQETAKDLKTKLPKNIVLGVSPNFYITNANTKVLPSKKMLKGRTVYLSATLCRFLDVDEFKAIIAHELMHYKGGDLTYTRTFFPIYRSLNGIVNSIEDSENVAGIFLLVNINPLHAAFTNAERRISRKRELAADTGASEVTSPISLASALAKVSLFSSAWQDALTDNANALSINEIINKPADAIYGYAVYEFTPDFIDEQLKNLANMRMSHPTDTHPTMLERFSNLEVDQKDIPITYFDAFGETKGAFEVQHDEVESQLATAFLYETLNRFPSTQIPDEDDQESSNHRTAYRILYQVITHFIRADQKTLPEEIKSAEATGREHFGGFNPLIFREYVHGTEELVDIDQLSEYAAVVFNDVGLEGMETVLRQVIASDGEIDAREQNLLDRFLTGVETKKQLLASDSPELETE